MNIGTLVGKRGNQRAEDDGRILVCEACCNYSNCNNGGDCGVKGTVFDLITLYLQHKNIVLKHKSKSVSA